MVRDVFAACGLSLLFLPAAGPSPSALPVCPNDIPHEPLVQYEVSGFTLAGLVDRSLIVYSDGQARICSADGTGDGRALLAYLPAPVAKQLQLDLMTAGSLALCDETNIVVDSPLSTLTTFRGNTDAFTHSFSWWDGSSPPYDGVRQILDTFVAAHFPGF